VTNNLVRGYTNGNIEAWTVPCLYTVGKYLRIFAIKADEGGKTPGPTTDFGEELNLDAGKNHYLEDAARQLNGIFKICLSDRYLTCNHRRECLLIGKRAPLEESRKWGIYNIINLLFKTYFKLNSISLSKNILAAIRAYRGDMPDLESFPKAHQVTFKYYVGVIYFLEEDYVEVSLDTERPIVLEADP